MRHCAIIRSDGSGEGRDKSRKPAVPRMRTAIDQILLDVADGKPDGVEACLRRFSGPVWSLARRYLANDDDAEDAVQDIFVDLWKSASRFDPEIGSAMTFVMTLARRRLIDRTRKRGRTPKSESIAAAEEPVEAPTADPVEIDDEVQRVSDAMAQLRPGQREVLELSLVHGRSHQQIAESTGYALGTVKSHARRGLMRVRALLGVENEKQEQPRSVTRPDASDTGEHTGGGAS